MDGDEAFRSRIIRRMAERLDTSTQTRKQSL